MNVNAAFVRSLRQGTLAVCTTVLLLLTGLTAMESTLAGAAPHLESSDRECNKPVTEDPHRPHGYVTYFADEFDCTGLPYHWIVQGEMTPASYVPPANGYVRIDDGILQVGVAGEDVAFPYLYIVDDSATTYDVPHTTLRVDWIPDVGDFSLAMRVRFHIESLGEHRISIYADGHHPAYAGPLFYIGSDHNEQIEAWRGLILGADRGNQFVDMGDHGYDEPYTNWVVLTVDYRQTDDLFTMAVDGTPYLTRTLSSFKGAPHVATRPDTLYLGSLAYLESASSWIDIELDWLRVYAPSSTPAAREGILDATVEAAPTPPDSPTTYSRMLPSGPFANTPYWSEHFDDTDGNMPHYWRLLLNNDAGNSSTSVHRSHATIGNNGRATAVPVWGVSDDMRLGTEQTATHSKTGSYLTERLQAAPDLMAWQQRIESNAGSYFNWRPNSGNVRYAWKAVQTANGYGVEVSNGGHFPYFTGAMFYTLLDTTADSGRGQFIFPSCQEKYFWRLNRLPHYAQLRDMETIVTADYINGTVHLYVNGEKIGWWPESDCSMNWYLQGENATSPDLLFFGNPATEKPGSWSEVSVDWFATFPGLPTEPVIDAVQVWPRQINFQLTDVSHAEPITDLLSLSFGATEPIQWVARLNSVPSWLSFSPLPAPTYADDSDGIDIISGTTVVPNAQAHVVLTATRPITYGIYDTTLTLTGETAAGSQIEPVHVSITMRYQPKWRQHEANLPIVGSLTNFSE